MKKIILCSALLVQVLGAGAQTDKDYQSVMKKIQQFYNGSNADKMYKMYAPLMANALSQDKTKDLFAQLKGELGEMKSFQFEKSGGGNHSYISTFENDKKRIILAINDSLQVEGLFFQNYVEPVSKVMQKFTSDFIIEPQPGVKVDGSLVMPEHVSKPNVVLIIAGSGPTDRNGNGVGIGTNAYSMLADSLREAGIASVRYDKRGVGHSQGNIEEAQTRFDDFVNDAVAFIEKIRSSKKFGKIFIAGHSEGSLIGMIAANKTNVDGFISIAGAAEPAQNILTKQLSTKTMPGNSYEEAVYILKQLEQKKTVPQIQNKNLMTLFRPSVQPYMISWFAYNPQEEIKKINAKILILQGDKDVQVGTESGKILQDANPKSALFVVPGVNHVLKEVGEDSELAMKSYNNPTLPLSKEISRKIIAFCK